MKITIGGECFTGKGPVSLLLAQRLGYDHVSGRAILNSLLLSEGIDSLDFYSNQAISDYVYGKVDAHIQVYAREHRNGNFIVSSHLAWRWIPESIKICLRCDLGVKVALYVQKKREEGSLMTAEQARESLTLRDRADRMQYKLLYSVENFADPAYYDHIVLMDNKSPEEVADEIQQLLQQNTRP